MISDCLELYLRLKAAAKPETFRAYTKSEQSFFTECVGNLFIVRMSPQNGADFRNNLMANGLLSFSVSRVCSILELKSIFASLKGLVITNSFSGVCVPEDNLENKWQPIPLEIIRDVQAECQTNDDD